ncbi:MAG: CesT family type III secretion system chaperone [Puniceicoccales bacterium]|jgi:hypothetical protein|nr:CesT family type III secretion system chaperone [Puniceicoccales bacterium]
MAMDGEHLLREVGERMRIPLKLDPKTCRCVVKNRTSREEYLIEFPPKNPFLYIYTVLRPLDNEDDGPFLRKLLTLNLFGLQTDGCTIGVDDGSRNIILHLAFPIEFVSVQIFVNLLTNFIETAKKMRAGLDDIRVIATRELKKKQTHYSPAECMDKEKPKNNMRIIRI